MRHLSRAAALALCAACTTIQSSSIKTSGMSASMQVVADGTGQTTASAQFNVDNNATDFIDLSPGDSAITQVAGQSRTMSRSDFLGAISYQTTFTGLDADGTQYTIALTRSSDVSAPSSVCVLPKPFNITAPTANGSFSRAGSDLVVTYDTTGTLDTMSWSAGGDCVKGLVGGTVSGDSGSLTIAKGTLVSSDPSQANVTCQAHVTLTRQRPGQLDSHFGSGGRIVAQQVRTVTFNSTP
jgi:hypothetical protein